ncbi:E3 ubiquitin-protein ligase MARCHF3-like [Cylas formicarius]|uniref:E3 ubiquitin-protein ligase MARCHF3-like n=1 Tax=Cylas formicarius TaxID=197179 RepID=UPI0029584348|nr:E3 ubiquitin-protein ligase MARCHF3-like [Cylas formicarius]
MSHTSNHSWIASRNSDPKLENSNHVHNNDAPVKIANSVSCRICQTSTASERLISPCRCRGTLANVHLSCLERWLNQSSRNYCELCKFRYNAVETQRYRLLQSLRLWLRHPQNRTRVRSDCLIGMLLTGVTTGLLAICVCGMDYFVDEAVKMGVKRVWIQVGVIAFLCVIVAGYVLTAYLLLRDHFVPWYGWWRRAVNIRLELPPESIPASGGKICQ